MDIAECIIEIHKLQSPIDPFFRKYTDVTLEERDEMLQKYIRLRKRDDSMLTTANRNLTHTGWPDIRLLGELIRARTESIKTGLRFTDSREFPTGPQALEPKRCKWHCEAVENQAHH
jgi:hypothetical protein